MRTVIGRYASWFALFALVLLTGCIGPTSALQNGYVDFDRAYADASNKQLLLNLARLANDDPVQFIQLGSFSAQYQYTYGGTASASYVRAWPERPLTGQTTTSGSTPPSGGSTTTYSYTAVPNPLTIGASLNGSVTETPIFQYLPLTGSNLVDAVLVPISDKVFLTFYDQGYSANVVARTMVASVQHVIGTSTKYVTNREAVFPSNYPLRFLTNYVIDLKTNNTTVTYAFTTNIVPSLEGCYFTNKITFNVTTNYEYYVNRPGDKSYPDFLKFCDQLFEAQKYHALTVGPAAGSEKIVYQGPTTLTDVVAAVLANLSVKYNTNSGLTTVAQLSQARQFVENLTTVISITNNQEIEYTNPTTEKEEAIHTNIALDLPESFTVTNGNLAPGQPLRYSDFQKNIDYINDYTRGVVMRNQFASQFNANYVLKMRTVEAAMYTAANEENRYKYFSTLTDSNLDDCFLKKHANDIIYGAHPPNNNIILAPGTVSNGGIAWYYSLNGGVSNYMGTNNIIYSTDTNGLYAFVIRENDKPFIVRPLMRLTVGPGENLPYYVLTKIEYSDLTRYSDPTRYSDLTNQTYYVGDLKDETQNRTVFTLLSYLFAQAAISTQNLPVQQLIQVP